MKIKSWIVLACLLLATGCSQNDRNADHQIPVNSTAELQITLPTNSEDGTEWDFEADKESNDIWWIVIKKNDKKTTFKQGHTIKIGGIEYTIDHFSDFNRENRTAVVTLTHTK